MPIWGDQSRDRVNDSDREQSLSHKIMEALDFPEIVWALQFKDDHDMFMYGHYSDIGLDGLIVYERYEDAKYRAEMDHAQHFREIEISFNECVDIAVKEPHSVKAVFIHEDLRKRPKIFYTK